MKLYETRNIAPTSRDLTRAHLGRFGSWQEMGPMPRSWMRVNYYPPDVHYEAVVSNLVREGTRWLDVGCGRGIFPDNRRLAQDLIERCETVVGIDPDETVEENSLVHSRIKTSLEDFRSDEGFDLVTMRMVAEHLTNPDQAAASLARATRLGGRVVIFTVNKWALVSLAAWLVPYKLHHPVKSYLWGTEEKDTFPVAYKMNTRRSLERLFHHHGFTERHFSYLPDCVVFHRFRPLHTLELLAWYALDKINVTYPENCLLAVYEKTQSS